MVKLWTAVFIAAIIGTAVVQGATLYERSCPKDVTAPTCQTSGASPNADDCQKAIKMLSGDCTQSNEYKSLCQTLVTFKTCKIDVCGQQDARLKTGVHCGGYLQTILNTCHSGGRVGGELHPQTCNVEYKYKNSPESQTYKLQVSHSASP